MIEQEIQNFVFTIFKLGGIIFTLIHLLIVLILLRQANTMKRVVKTKTRGCVVFVLLVHVLLLFGILLVVILVKV